MPNLPNKTRISATLQGEGHGVIASESRDTQRKTVTKFLSVRFTRMASTHMTQHLSSILTEQLRRQKKEGTALLLPRHFIASHGSPGVTGDFVSKNKPKSSIYYIINCIFQTQSAFKKQKYN